MSKIREIHIPNKIIYNYKDNPDSVSQQAFGLFVGLKVLSFNNIYNNTTDKLLTFTKWTDIDTLKKYINELTNKQFIEHNYKSLPKTDNIKIEILNIIPFTKVDINTVNRIIELTSSIHIKGNQSASNYNSIALRLFYYYKKQYNKKNKCAFPSYKTIHDSLGISSNQIAILNKIFEDNNLLIIKHGKWDEGSGSKKKNNNKYIPLKYKAVRDG